MSVATTATVKRNRVEKNASQSQSVARCQSQSLLLLLVPQTSAAGMSLLGDRLADKVSKFNSQINRHLESQQLNPFSGQFSRSPSPRPFAKDEYGKPLAGSMTEMRGEVDCVVWGTVKSTGNSCINLILSLFQYSIIEVFLHFFQMYTKISNKVVGLLLAAKKRGLVYFEGEMLFQRRDDNVLIALIKPIEEIRRILKESISPAPLDDEPSVGC
ncbi:hypothetical protein LSTR_LSTR004334 [Laodelphax striatellus]|uniref:Costars domain-containing protein n=1 Tax=Laodelphax striatellus TaxID=195883 RepID=A0A482X8B0_LAOST|nr:hypothetical protein LSTR_LSTR004334 [Laodelphax striatellus]